MKKDLPLYIIVFGLFVMILYTIISGLDNRDSLYLIITDESFYTTENILIDSNNCLIFVDNMTERKVKVCDNYEIKTEIKTPKDREFED